VKVTVSVSPAAAAASVQVYEAFPEASVVTEA